ncbi:MAG: EamA family transporter [Nanoarchaeota archaeon]|nr:EamA family transporter [Nanoarchaeota archaeon]MBU1321091.1 EamA family transporter [Nanoarchaeota archaeon]MBU1596954.1 EamA family transporter [Nanoarchaeota archaeon]MBU2441253.1 EamA family transporter [Nanoarchaeota archaeon]
MLNTLAIVLVVIGTVIGAFGSLYLKRGAKYFNLNIFKQIKNRELILGIVLFVFGSVFYIYALTMERLSVLYPLTSLTYIWVAFVSVWFLKEKMNKYKWAGIALIVLGIIIIGLFSV